MALNDDIADMEKANGICSLTFVADNFSHPSTFPIKDSRSA